VQKSGPASSDAEHPGNGDLETWAPGSVWLDCRAVAGTASPGNRAGYVYSGASACKVLHPNTGTATKAGHVPGPGTGGCIWRKWPWPGIGESSYAPEPRSACGWVNVTKNTSYNGATAAWASGVTQQVANTVGQSTCCPCLGESPGSYSISDVRNRRLPVQFRTAYRVIDAVSLTGPSPSRP